MTKCRQCVLLTAALMMASTAFALEDGVYRDQADGYGGKVILTVRVRDGKIQSVETENTGGEKSEYYLKAEKEMIPAIVAANGTDGVDTVSGATGTSESILKAMEGILEQAAYTGGLMDDVKNMTKDAMDGAKDMTKDAVEGAGEAVQNGGQIVNNAVNDAVNSVKEPTLTAEPKPTV